MSVRSLAGLTTESGSMLVLEEGAAAAVARLGDEISHGGAITGASTDVMSNGIGVARLGDSVNCSIHGAQTIVTASGTVTANGLGVARLGDAISCGATISTGSPTTNAG